MIKQIFNEKLYYFCHTVNYFSEWTQYWIYTSLKFESFLDRTHYYHINTDGKYSETRNMLMIK